MQRGFLPGRQYKGCIWNESSPAALINHIRAMHKLLLPPDTQVCRKRKAGPDDDEDAPRKVDGKLARDWALNICLGALQPVSSVSDAHFREVLQPRLPGLPGKTRLSAEVGVVLNEIRHEVKETLQQALQEGALFVISADSWKPKMRVRHSYVAIYLHWLSKAWTYEEVCLGVEETSPPRNGENYQAVFGKVLADNQLSAQHLVAAVTDHEGSIRRGFRLMKLPLVGCGCHALQWTCKHCIPPLRTRQSQGGDSSSSSSDSSSDDGSAASADEDEPARPARGGRKADAAAVRLQSSLKPFFKQMRAIVAYYKHQSDDYVALQKDCSSANLVCKSFASETPTRWSSSLTSLISVLVNNKGHIASRHARQSKAPQGLDRDDVRLGLELSALLNPIRQGTKLLEASGEKALGSLYLPTWHQVGQALQKSRFPLPKDLHGVAEAEDIDITLPLAKELQTFLRRDLDTVRQRHLAGTAGWGRLVAGGHLARLQVQRSRQR